MSRAHAFGWVLGTALLLVACGGGTEAPQPDEPSSPTGPPLSIRRFDFQNEEGPVATGFTKVTPEDAYDAERGHGFTDPPAAGIDGTRKTWTVFGKTYSVEQVIPRAVLSDATVDCVVGGREDFGFRVDVVPGSYDVTVWLGDVTAPRHQVRATVNGVATDVERMDVNNRRGQFDQTVYGNAVPRTVRIAAPDGVIEMTVGPTPGGDGTIEWTYDQDEDPKNPPETKTAVLVPAFSEAGLQALTLHPAADPPLVLDEDRLVRGGAPSDPLLDAALAAFNAGEIESARQGFEGLTGASLRLARAAGLLWVAGHPALIDEEPDLLEAAEALCLQALTEDADDFAAQDLLLQIRVALGAERSRAMYGYAASGTPATDNLGRSCSLVENLPPTHPYHLKGRILWLRNRGGLDPRRVTVSWERAQWLARKLDPLWGDVNPYVHVYATDEWQNVGRPWRVTDWASVAGAGPDWARALMSNLNGWLDLFEWWSIHRQSPEGDIGGGWTDDVEIVPAFGLMAYVLEDASDIARHATVLFADGIWNSRTIDREKGYQAQYADVEHTAEPTGNILHLYPLVRFGDPEGIERMLKSARTFAEDFLTPARGGRGTGHRHFKGNHMSATEIARNDDHQADIPLCGRVTAPFPFLLWYTSNPGIEQPLGDWIGAWVEDAAREENRKPAGVFPQALWTPTDGIGYPDTGDWWSRSTQYGQYSAFPGYQFYLYNLAGYFYLRTGEDRFRAPFDAVQAYAQAWVDARRPPAGATPPDGQEDVWCGALLPNVAQGATTNLAAATGLTDWDSFLARFAGSYGQFRLDPTDTSSIDALSDLSDELYEKWPYRTTEGVMTDRILVVGWADVISYYLGAEVFSVFFGMPVHAVTWANAPRLFAAAVTATGPTEVGATLYLFTDEGREIQARFWQLEPGATYALDAGPASGLGVDPSPIAQTVSFSYDHLGDGATFTLPARTVTAIRVRQTAPPTGTRGLLPDLAVAPRDVAFDTRSGEVVVTVHNVGSLDSTPADVTLYGGLDSSGPVLASGQIGRIAPPTDLVPRSVRVSLAHVPPETPAAVTVVVESQTEITHENNTATAWIGGTVPDLPPPMLVELSSLEVTAGETLTLHGRNFQPGAVPLASEAPSAQLALTVIDGERATVEIGAGQPPGILLVSIRNPDGKRSNLLPVAVVP